MASITIALLTLLLASISFINNNQSLIAQSNAVLTKPQDVQANLTTAFDSLMNPKVLLGSAIDQIRNSTARSANLPCDSNSKSPLQIRVGQPSDIRPVQLKLIT